MLRIISITLCFLFLFPQMSQALIINEYLGDVSVSVEGNKRSKPQLIESLVEKCLEKRGFKKWDAVDTESLRQCIANSRLFSEVAVEVKPPEIRVSIKERWTLIPVPMAYATNGKRSVGVFVFDSNLLGYGKTVGVGGAVSTEGDTVSLFYLDPSVNFSDYTLRISAVGSSTEFDAYDQTTIIYGYNKREESFSFSPGYKITPSLEMSLSLNYADRHYSQLDQYTVPEDYWAWSAGARITYTDTDYKLFYNDGLSGQIAWTDQMQRSGNGRRISNTTARIEWDVLVFDKHALQFVLNAANQSDATAGDVSMFGRTRGYRGIQPNGLWTREIVAGSVDYQIPVAKMKHGTVTVAPFADYGVYKPFFPGTGSNYAAYGIGAYYFINIINLPGIGLQAGVNEHFMGAFVAFQIGMAFGPR